MCGRSATPAAKVSKSLLQETPNAKHPDIEISLRKAPNTNIKTSTFAESQDELVYNIVNFQ
jgi:hypothetical protein